MAPPNRPDAASSMMPSRTDDGRGDGRASAADPQCLYGVFGKDADSSMALRHLQSKEPQPSERLYRQSGWLVDPIVRAAISSARTKQYSRPEVVSRSRASRHPAAPRTVL